jgi:hypothetical protein
LYSLHKLSVSVLFIFLFPPAPASDPYIVSAGATESGMGYSCVSKPGFWSSFGNQASLASVRSFSAGINYENRFNISELGTRTIGAVIPSGKTTIGALYSNFGYREFTRHTAGIACGMELSKRMSAGVQIDFFLEKTPGDYRERKAVTFEAGVIISASEKTSIGIQIFNPLPGTIRKTYLPTAIRAGAGTNLSSSFYASAEVQMCMGRKPEFRTGFEYKVTEKFLVRSGFSSRNTSFCFGIGYRLKSVGFDLSMMTHERLGVTSAASMIFQINKP